MKKLLLVSAALEVPAGLCLGIAPSSAVRLLLGAPLDAPVAQLVARVAGVALLALGQACWLARSNTTARAAWGLVAALLVYNLGVVLLLGHARLGSGLSGIGLWPAIGLHLLMSAWCVAALRNPPA